MRAFWVMLFALLVATPAFVSAEDAAHGADAQAGTQPVKDTAEHVAPLVIGTQPVGVRVGRIFGTRRQPTV